MKKISFRTTVLSLFIFLAVIIIAFMTYLHSYYEKKFSQKLMDNNFHLVSSEIKRNLTNFDASYEFFFDEISTCFSKLDSIEDIKKQKDFYLKLLTTNLSKNKTIDSVSFNFLDGSFFELIDLDIDKKMKEEFSLKKDSLWLLVIVDSSNQNIQQMYAFDKNLNLLQEKVEKNNYYPSEEEWFITAKAEKNLLIKTRPHQFHNIHGTGMTYAKRFNDNVIFEIDVLTKDFEKSLKTETTMEGLNNFIFDKDKKIIFSSSKDKTYNIKILNFVHKHKLIDNHEYFYTIDGKDYVMNASLLDDDIHKYLLTIVPYDDLMQDFSQYLKKIFLFTAIFFVALLPLAYYFASIIVKSVLKLKEQSIKIKNRDYFKTKLIESRVTEMQELSNAMLQMEKSIYEHQTNLEDKVKERTRELLEKNIQLEILAVTDKLTDVSNRIKLDTSLEDQLSRAKRYSEVFGVILVDIDNFKNVNDTFGHQVGDEVLIKIASILKENTRSMDTVGRWGGEEFLIICPHTNLRDSSILANKIREIIEQYDFNLNQTKTASFGVTIYKKEDTLESIVNRADRALYQAKDNGRNRVEVIL